MIKIKFLKDFATKSKGDVIEIDGMIAVNLINRKIAEKFTKESKPKKKKVEKKTK